MMKAGGKLCSCNLVMKCILWHLASLRISKRCRNSESRPVCLGRNVLQSSCCEFETICFFFFSWSWWIHYAAVHFVGRSHQSNRIGTEEWMSLSNQPVRLCCSF
jgi:hypothetical protein